MTKISHHNVSLRSCSNNRDPGGKAGGDAGVVYRIFLSIRPFFIHITCYYHIYTTYFGEGNSGIIEGDRDYDEGVLHYKFWFQSFG